MRRLRIGPRLTLSFAIIVLLMFIGSAVGLWQLNAMRMQAQKLHHIDTEVEAILRVHNSFLTLQDHLRQSIFQRDATGLEQEFDNLRENLITDLDEAIEVFENSSPDSVNNAYDTYLNQLNSIRTSLMRRVDSVTALALADNWTAAELHLKDPLAQESQHIQALVNEISDSVATEQRLALENMVRTERQALMATTITGTLILAAAGLLGFIVTRSIAQPLIHLDIGAKALAHREFEYRILIDGDDELTHLSLLFNDTAQQLADLYTDLEGVVWQRTQALQESTEELHHRYLQLETSIAVGQQATSILDLDALLNEVVELICRRFGYYYVGVFLLDESGDYVKARAGTGDAGRTLRERNFRLKVGQEGIVGWVAQNRLPLRIDDVSQDDRYIKLEVVPDTSSECALPLMMGKEILGVLDIQSRELTAFRMEDMPVLQSLADQVAIAIQNATLYQRERDRRQLAETLYRVGRAISRTLDLEEVLDLILEHLAVIVPYDRAAIMLKNHDELEFAAARGFPEEIQLTQVRIPIKENADDVFRRIYQSQQPLIIADVLQEPSWQHLPGLNRARAWLGIPLIRFDNVIGMLSLTRETPNAYSEDQAKLSTTFAGQAATALENARLYDRITRFTQQLEDMVRERTEALQEAYTQLEHLDRTKSDFIHIAAHELRTPLTILRGYSQILMGDSDIQQNTQHKDMITSIHSGAIRLHEIVNGMLDISKIDSRALKLYPEPLAVHPLIQLVCQDFQAALNERQQKITMRTLSTLPMIEADPDALHKVFYHLLSNAIKYTPDNGEITISGQPLKNDQREADRIKLVISDTGIGIDPDFHDLIFTKFYQTGELALHSSSKTNFKGGGPGLGLAIAKGIVEAHHGEMWVESDGYDEEKLPGSHFYIVLPVRQPKFDQQTLPAEQMRLATNL